MESESSAAATKVAITHPLERLLTLTATAVQGIVAAIALIDYVYLKTSEIVGSEAIDWIIIAGFAGTSAIALVLMALRQKRLSNFQKELLRWVFALGLVASVMYSIMYFSERRRDTIIVYPVEMENMPFLLLRSYGFEGNREGWEVSKQAAPVLNTTIDGQTGEAFEGKSFLRLRVDLPGSQHSTVLYTETITLWNSDYRMNNLTEGVVAYIKIFPSEQTEDNEFRAEIQVRSGKDGKYYWSKTQYELVTGKWQPIVWTRPSFLAPENGENIHYPRNIDSVTIMIWSEKPFKGHIGIDNISYYLIRRP